MTMRRATIVLSGPEAGVVYEALRPETGRDVPKARVAMRSAPGRLTLTIDADDTGEATGGRAHRDRKSTRLNSSHANISYAVFCLKKKKLHIEAETTYAR